MEEAQGHYGRARGGIAGRVRHGRCLDHSAACPSRLPIISEMKQTIRKGRCTTDERADTILRSPGRLLQILGVKLDSRRICGGTMRTYVRTYRQGGMSSSFLQIFRESRPPCPSSPLRAAWRHRLRVCSGHVACGENTFFSRSPSGALVCRTHARTPTHPARTLARLPAAILTPFRRHRDI